MAERRVLNTTGNISTFEIDVKVDKDMVKTSFQACASAKLFKAFVGALGETSPGEGEPSPLENVYNLYLTQADLKARAKVRPSLAAEGTVITRDGVKIDIMTRPVKNAVAAINAHYAEVSNLGGKPGTAFAVSRRKLLEAGTVVEKDGVLAVK